MLKRKPYCLVLGGGGAKGVYHIGVWQALRELRIPVNAFIGNSIGAIMGAFFAQHDEDKLIEISENIDINSLIQFADEEHSDKGNSLRQSIKYWQAASQKLIQRKGLDTRPIRKLLEQALDEQRIRQSGYDFGITTINVSDLQPRDVFIENMEAGELINYVLASASFPGFEQPTIAGKKYIDGGLYDNLPYRMARQRGYRKIILVDISGIGVSRRPKTEGSETIYIKNSIDMGSVFDFSSDFMVQYRQLGYLDTMRVFGKLKGYRYFLKNKDRLEKKWQAKQQHNESLAKLKKYFPDEMKHDRRDLLKIVDTCAQLLQVDKIKAYSFSDLISAINEELADTENKAKRFLAKHHLDSDQATLKLLDALTKEVMTRELLSENPYYYYLLMKDHNHKRTIAIAEKALFGLVPELEILKFYLTDVRDFQA
ncbi:patatin-like phospholipase family protein [Reinekea thalattae]|uniref:Patatin-like phospholipase family protein n=1 Tax=Reinekea thalattae TaxID=2593301 RepID=A0A5C8Z784_9GAMM|nr:patatin-like phospholipase family protein [Reinekea thalattae]TXR53812.1 patatin-like phospholipase family protein [Reinekea thalattae]